MERAFILGVLVVATALEAGGDAVIRAGLHQPATGARMALFLVGAIMLFCYGFLLNQAPYDFGRLIGVYVAAFFLVGQVINLAAFKTLPSSAVVVGGLFILLGGAVMTLWE